jgi:hypothetical protein
LAERRHRLPDDLVQELLDAIEDTGRIHARAKAEAARLEHRRKRIKASMMKVMEAHGVRSHQKQEVDALCHPNYDAAVELACSAIEAEANAEVDLKNAEREYEAWRTLSANARAAR